MMKRNVLLALGLITLLFAYGANVTEFSKAGFFPLENSPRQVYSLNPGWKLFKGALKTAPVELTYDDQAWSNVNLPNGMEYLPEEASGGANYQGEAWYRKRFTIAPELKGKKLQLHFEAIMGKSKVWVNGELVKEQFSGFLPVIVYIEKYIKWDEENILTVLTDNSDDPNYPPGKPQNVLDFCYFGGIYRDVWLVSHESTFITDPNAVDKVAGGGVFVSFDGINREEATVRVDLDVCNEKLASFRGKVELTLTDRAGKVVARSRSFAVKSGGSTVITERVKVKSPLLWSPEDPHLYNLTVRLVDGRRNEVDGLRLRVGIRSIEMRGTEGFFLNGERYPRPLMGANRHQDFAVVGNALSNSLHWRDAYKLRSMGLELIRNAHYPQDPAFMDACDELGLFVIVNTPGWQFWNDKPPFEERVYSDIRNMVRRDRNRASVLLWEPILNESHYPSYFAEKVEKMVHEEFPFAGVYSASDKIARGSEYFPVIFNHPMLKNTPEETVKMYDPKKSYYTREWGDNVDSWSSHNSPSRVSRGWGETAQLVQANLYGVFPKGQTSLITFYKTYPMVFGGALWHSFDHQRGYHPDPFYGGVMDAYRQPKYSYQMFRSQRSPEVNPNVGAESGPMIYIAHEMTPFSPKDVTIFTNCDEVRLTVYGDEVHTQKVLRNQKDSIPSPIVVFKDIHNFMRDKALTRSKKGDQVFFLAEGLIDGKVVATDRRVPSRRPSGIKLKIDDHGMPLEANGGDLMVVTASITDENGVVKRLNNSMVKFEIEGEAEIVGDGQPGINPLTVRWGEASVLIRSTLKAGPIKVRARLLYPSVEAPVAGELVLESKPSTVPALYVLSAGESKSAPTKVVQSAQKVTGKRIDKSVVEEQQSHFGE